MTICRREAEADTCSPIRRISSGAFVGLMALPVSKPSMGGQGDIGRRTGKCLYLRDALSPLTFHVCSLSGMLFTVCSIGALCGPPISGAIHDSIGGYVAVGYYAGMFLCGSLVFGVQYG